MNNNTGFSGLVRDSTYNIVRLSLAIFLGVITSALIARGLGPTNQGEYSISLLVPLTLTTFADFGISFSIIYFIAHGDFDLTTVVQQTILLSTIISILSIVVGFFLIKYAGNELFPGVDEGTLMLALFIIPAMLFRTNLGVIFQGLQDFRTYNLVEIVPQLFMLVFVIIFIWIIPLDVGGALLAYLFSQLVGIAILGFFLFKQVRVRNLLRVRFSLLYLKRTLSYGIPTYFSNVITFLNLRADKYLLNIMAGVSSVGIYDVSVQISEKLWVVSRGIGTVLFPRVASMEDNDSQQNHLTAFLVRSVLWSSIIISLIVYPFSDLIVRLLYGKEFIEASIGFKLLLPGIIFLGGSRLLSFHVAGQGKPIINTIAASIGFLINLISNLLLIPILGLRGASISSSISYTVIFLVRSFIFCRSSGMKFQSLIIFQRSDWKLWKNAIFHLIKKPSPDPKLTSP